jgi:hypothetical protein
MATYIGNVGSSIFADVPRQELLNFHYRVLDYKERGLDEIPFTGFSADYVYRESLRARRALQGTSTLLWPGIDVDIPTAENHSKCTQSGTKDAVLAAFHGGADGVLISRKYSEMKLGNLKAVGEAIRQLARA